MHREKMEGVNLREELMEVAFEQWTEHILWMLVDFNAFPALEGSNIGMISRIGRVQRYFSEFRW